MRYFLIFINDLLWGSVMIYLLAGAGLWFLWLIRRLPLRYVSAFSAALKNNNAAPGGSITPFQALTIAFAARAGSGNLVAAALALIAGGPGAIFWMWVASLLGMAITFAECTLAQLYRRRDSKGQLRGGPAWYMEHALGMYWIARLFAVLLVLTFGFLFNALQANAISRVASYTFNLPPEASAVPLVVLVVLMVRRGIQGIARVTQWLVPLFALAWIIPALGVLIWHIDRLPDILWTILSGAFGWHSAAAGAMGYTLGQALNNGFQRGMFSSEAGLGSTPNVAGATVGALQHPASQGLVQIMGVFIDTLVIGSLSGTLLLLSGVMDNTSLPVDGHLMMYNAMTVLLGSWGGNFITLVFCCFAFISIAANVVYAENNLGFLTRISPYQSILFRAGVATMVVLGCFVSMPSVWQLAKIAMALMAIINLLAILMLAPVVKVIVSDWLRQRKLGLDPVFDPAHYPELNLSLEPGVWDNHIPGSYQEHNHSHRL